MAQSDGLPLEQPEAAAPKDAAPGAVCGVPEAGAEAPMAPDAPAVAAWNEEVVPALSHFQSLSAQVAPLVSQQAELVHQALQEVYELVVMASTCKKPAQGIQSSELQSRLQPLQSALQKVIKVRDQNRDARDLLNHLSTVSEGIPAAGWVAVEPTPGPYINDMKDSAQFYANRVIKDMKDKDATHVQWARAFMDLLEALRTYVMAHHRTGLTWNAQGKDLAAYKSRSSAPAPPAPPAPATAPAPAASMDAVFSQINQGEGITRSLRKVDPSEMTHKNPDLRTHGVVQDAVSKPAPASKPANLSVKKRTPVKALEGNKWTIEHFENESHIVVDGTEIGQTVNIFHCQNCVIEIKGKVNAVSLLSCTKTSVLLDTLVSSLEVTRCNAFAAQVTGYTPTILIDSTDGGQVYLSEQGLQTEIITAKSSSLNVSVPAANGEPGELEEIPLPEQIKHTLQRSSTKSLAHSEVVQHAG
ncbi:suppressor of rasval19 [Malassezia caprae]|uniref:Adenylyl cyclase-associated protein n=1 Tax=Malassezia caprae TaxID=1381934 RepID=A0AAF0EAM8_9BASI|nr:suppressor of rasval19 [Malassezia caprae]